LQRGDIAMSELVRSERVQGEQVPSEPVQAKPAAAELAPSRPVHPVDEILPPPKLFALGL
jgi:hypothetical protein